MATTVKDTLSHADKFKEFGLFRERTTLVFPLFSDSIKLALDRFMIFLAEDMCWADEDASYVIAHFEVLNSNEATVEPYEVMRGATVVIISGVRMDNNLIIHYDVYRYED